MITYDNISIATIRSGKGDCIHLRFVGATGIPHNIIIDSGPSSAAGEFRSLIASIISAGESLDALFITHYDEDHIGSILRIGDPGFRDIYFNAYDGAEQTGNLSAVQNQQLFHMLPTVNVHASVSAGNVIELDGAKITIHAPTEKMLSRALQKMREVDVPLAAVHDWENSLDELMARPYPCPDSSIANQSSIVFTFEYGPRRLLFCGDAWAENIPGGEYDLVKLPHHGSIRNISEDLLSKLEANVFLICADGTSHPNKQTVAKLLQRYGRVTIYSNYSWWMNVFLNAEDMKYIQNGKLIFRNVQMSKGAEENGEA